MTIRVILADDHTVVRDGLRALLEANSDIKIVGNAANGRQVVNQLQALQPDIVIMDISMPELNGIEATRQILNASSEVGVIILSMVGSPEHIFRALQAGARGYLLKESAGREVMEAVETVFAGGFYLSQPITQTLITDYLQVRGRSQTDQLNNLSQRELEILKLVVKGQTSAEIGASLFLSPKTVESYRSRMMLKLGISDMPELVKFAIRKGLISLD